MITIVDYGMGNLGSVLNMCKRIEVPARISADLNEIRDADKVILPGVGSFDHAMKRLTELGIKEVVLEKARDGTPILGICLGMQLLTDGSEEGGLAGMGLIPGRAYRFARKPGLQVPHMGWNSVIPKRDHPLLINISEASRFYFVHSYYVKVHDLRNILFTATYDVQFEAGIFRNNVMGVQFHPEKSHRYGMMLIKNFSQIHRGYKTEW